MQRFNAFFRFQRSKLDTFQVLLSKFFKFINKIFQTDLWIYGSPASVGRKVDPMSFVPITLLISNLYNFLKLIYQRKHLCWRSVCQIVPYARYQYPLLNCTRSRIVPAPLVCQEEIVAALEQYPHLFNFVHFVQFYLIKQ